MFAIKKKYTVTWRNESLFHSDKAEFDDIVIGLTELYEQWKTIEYLKKESYSNKYLKMTLGLHKSCINYYP